MEAARTLLLLFVNFFDVLGDFWSAPGCKFTVWTFMRPLSRVTHHMTPDVVDALTREVAVGALVIRVMYLLVHLKLFIDLGFVFTVATRVGFLRVSHHVACQALFLQTYFITNLAFKQSSG